MYNHQTIFVVINIMIIITRDLCLAALLFLRVFTEKKMLLLKILVCYVMVLYAMWEKRVTTAWRVQDNTMTHSISVQDNKTSGDISSELNNLMFSHIIIICFALQMLQAIMNGRTCVRVGGVCLWKWNGFFFCGAGI